MVFNNNNHHHHYLKYVSGYPFLGICFTLSIYKVILFLFLCKKNMKTKCRKLKGECCAARASCHSIRGRRGDCDREVYCIIFTDDCWDLV